MIDQKLNTKQILSKNLARKANPLLSQSILFLHNLRSMHNIGSAYRTADAFGLNKIILSGYSPVPPRPEISKTALGAEETVDWEYANDPLRCLSALKKQNYIIAGIEQTKNSILLPHYTPEKNKICFIFGNEVTGIEDKLLTECDVILEIPQFGHKHSLNVSVSIGITLYSMLEKTHTITS